MPPATPPRETAAAAQAGLQRREIVRQIAVSIGELGTHLASQNDLAAAVATTTGQAKAIAFKALQVMVGGPDAPQAARELGNDLERFAGNLAALSERAGREAVLSSEAASVLMMAAAEFNAVADDPRAIADSATLRARLRPLADKLETIPERLREGKVIAKAFAEEAQTAVALASRGKLMAAAQPGQMAQDVYDAMAALAGETRKLSDRLQANAARGREVAAMMANRVQDLAKPANEWGRATNRSELNSVIGRGAAVVW